MKRFSKVHQKGIVKPSACTALIRCNKTLKRTFFLQQAVLSWKDNINSLRYISQGKKEQTKGIKTNLQKNVNRMTKTEFQHNLREALDFTVAGKDIYRDFLPTSFSASSYIMEKPLKFPKDLNYLNTIISVDTYFDIMENHRLHFQNLQMFKDEKKIHQLESDIMSNQNELGTLIERNLYTKVDAYSPYMLISLLRGLHRQKLFSLAAIPSVKRLSRKVISMVNKKASSSSISSSPSSDSPLFSLQKVEQEGETQKTQLQTHKSTNQYINQNAVHIDEHNFHSTSEHERKGKIKQMSDHDNAVIMQILVDNIILASISKIRIFSAQEISDLLEVIRKMDYWPDERSLYIIDQAIHHKFHLDPNRITAQICLNVLYNFASLKYIPTVDFRTDFSSRIIIPTLRSLERLKMRNTSSLHGQHLLEVSSEENLKLMISGGFLEFKDITKQLRVEWLKLIQHHFLRDIDFPQKVPKNIILNTVSIEGTKQALGLKSETIRDPSVVTESKILNFHRKKYHLSEFATCSYVLHRHFDILNPSLAFIEEIKEYGEKYLTYFTLKDLYKISTSYFGFIEKKGFLQHIESVQEISETNFSIEPEKYIELPKIHYTVLDTFVKKFETSYVSQHGHTKQLQSHAQYINESFRDYFEQKLIREAKDLLQIKKTIDTEKYKNNPLPLSRDSVKAKKRNSSNETNQESEVLVLYKNLVKYIYTNDKKTFKSKELIEIIRTMAMCNYLPPKTFLDILTIIIGRTMFVEEPLSHLLAVNTSRSIINLLPSMSVRSQLGMNDYIAQQSIDIDSDLNIDELESFIKLMERRLSLLSHQRGKQMIKKGEGISDQTFSSENEESEVLTKRLNYKDYKWLANREILLSDVVTCAVPQEVSNCIISLGKLNYSPKKIDLFMEKLMSIVDRQMPDYNASQFVNILYGLSLMQYVPHRGNSGSHSRFGHNTYFKLWEYFLHNYMEYVIENLNEFFFNDFSKDEYGARKSFSVAIENYRQSQKKISNSSKDYESVNEILKDSIYEAEGLRLPQLEKIIKAIESLNIRHDFLSNYYHPNEKKRNHYRGNFHKALRFEKENKYRRMKRNPQCSNIDISEMYKYEYESTYEKYHYRDINHGLLFDILPIDISNDSLKGGSVDFDNEKLLNYNNIKLLQDLLSHKWMEKCSNLKFMERRYDDDFFFQPFPNSRKHVVEEIRNILPSLEEMCQEKGIHSIKMKKLSIPPFSDIPFLEAEFDLNYRLKQRKVFEKENQPSFYQKKIVVEEDLEIVYSKTDNVDKVNHMVSSLPILLDVEERGDVYENNPYNEGLVKAEIKLRKKWLEKEGKSKWHVLKIPYYAWSRCKNDKQRRNFVYKQLSKLHFITQKEHK